jgi:hypothetical protein
MILGNPARSNCETKIATEISWGALTGVAKPALDIVTSE